MNWYAYVGNDPVNGKDPTGLCKFQDSARCGGVSYEGDTSDLQVSKGAKVGAAVGLVAGAVAAAGCDVATVGICTAGNPLIIAGGTALGAVAGHQLEKAYVQLAGLVAKITDGKTEYQYALLTNSSGYYPDFRNGGLRYLEANAVFKYGTSANPSTRYPDSNISYNLGVRMSIQNRGSHYEVLAYEKMQLIKYALTHGDLPPGNRIFK
jgi:hypothetical protein